MYTVIYYSNSTLDRKLQEYCLEVLTSSLLSSKAQLVTVTWSPINYGENHIWTPKKHPYSNIYGQILKGIGLAKYETVFLAEHDVLYPESHFDLKDSQELKEGYILYNSNVYHLNKQGFFKAHDHNFLSTLVSDRYTLDRGIRAKLRELYKTHRVIWAEPEGPNGYKRIEGEHPIVDIRHESNLTGSRTSTSYETHAQNFWHLSEIQPEIF